MPDLRNKKPFYMFKSLSLKQEVQPFWQRTKTVIVGWFLGCTCKHHNEQYT